LKAAFNSFSNSSRLRITSLAAKRGLSPSRMARIFACWALPAAISAALAARSLRFLLLARPAKKLPSLTCWIRASVMAKLRRSGRSTVIFR